MQRLLGSKRAGLNDLVTILIGLGIGAMVELLLPGHTPAELVWAVLFGISGAPVARVVGVAGGWFTVDEPASFVASGLGEVIVLLLYGLFFRRNSDSHG